MDSQDPRDGKSHAISIRKLNANRQNSKKSTGPRTPRGKSYSRRNALKHGLFARDPMSFFVQRENPEDYGRLRVGLRARYKPIGMPEELEVERIALCWWRLNRVWRYENAVNRAALRSHVSRELGEQEEYCRKKTQEEEGAALALEAALAEIERTGEISAALRQKIYAIMPGLEALWPLIEDTAKEALTYAPFSKILREASAEERASVPAVVTATIAIQFLKGLQRSRATSIMEIAIAQHVIPNAEALDKLLRYEAANDRNLTRALDRLERLQQRRKAESA